MAISTGAGDPDRTLPLLWRRELGVQTGSRGPKQRVSIDAVVEAALALAVDEGIEAVSMRKVAERVGIGAMSLYTYLPGKAELLDLMVDEAVGRAPREAGRGSTPRERLELLAREEYGHFRAHPWLLAVDVSRAPLGPGSSERYEYQLGLVEGLGLDDVDQDAVVALVAGFAASVARVAIESERTRRASGVSDEEWWGRNAVVLERVMDGSRFPLSGRVGQAVGERFASAISADYQFEFGLGRLLDGIDALLAEVRP